MNNFINKNVNTYLKYYLKKFDFDSNDFINVEEITLSSFNMSGKFISNSLEDLKNFKNLKSLHISNYILNRENIQIIKNLEKLENYIFQKCDIKDRLEISGESIRIINCKKIDNLQLSDFKIIEFEGADLTDIEVKCDVLKLRNCVNLEKSKIEYNTVKYLEMDVE